MGPPVGSVVGCAVGPPVGPVVGWVVGSVVGSAVVCGVCTAGAPALSTRFTGFFAVCTGRCGCTAPGTARTGGVPSSRTGWGAAGTPYMLTSTTGSGIAIPCSARCGCGAGPPRCGDSHPAAPITTPSAATPTPPATSATNGCLTIRRCLVTYAARGSLKKRCIPTGPRPWCVCHFP
ncbi:hypothetical protein [Dactylosporangium maewongense]|uniref:hypothetical protein n=1 Tax=Dactylosporangium maewongense TaxID=634393 RepID=UPI0031DFC511